MLAVRTLPAGSLLYTLGVTFHTSGAHGRNDAGRRAATAEDLRALARAGVECSADWPLAESQALAEAMPRSNQVEFFAPPLTGAFLSGRFAGSTRMARLSINEMTTYRWSFEEDVVELKSAGIPAIGVWRQKVADVGEDRAVALLAQSGLAVSNLLWAGGFTGSDGHTFVESIQDAADAIRLAARLRAGCLVVYSGGAIATPTSTLAGCLPAHWLNCCRWPWS